MGNSVITNQDDPAEYLYLLLTGRARYFFLSRSGQKAILLWISPGEVFGAAALAVSPSAYLVSAEAIRSSSMLVWDRNTIRRLAAQYPKLIENALSLAMDYLVAYRTAHISLICNTAGERLAQVLTSLASAIGHRVEKGIELKISNEELSQEAHLTLFTTSRLLSKWQRRGVLLKGRGKILLRSPELLLKNLE
jgi:CRP-like cAMP-binding protein